MERSRPCRFVSPRWAPVLPALALAAATLVSCGEGEDGDLPFVSGPDRSTHAKYFPIDKDPHAVDCNSCHGAFDTFTKFSCTTAPCHPRAETDGRHDDPAYLYADAACYSCHKDGVVPGTGEHLRFPIGADTKHVDTSCGKCHLDRADRKKVDCAGACHPQAAVDPVHVVADYRYGSAECLACHPRGEAGFDHAPHFPIGPASVHKDASCKNCHRNAAVPREVTCAVAGCHDQVVTDGHHVGVPDYRWASGDCLICHPTGNADGKIDHTAFPIGPNDTHGKAPGIPCATCHADPNNRKNISCITGPCHTKADTDPRHVGIPDYRHDSPSCLTCHPHGEPTGRIDHARYFPITANDKHKGTTCRDCHANPLNHKQVTCADLKCHLQAAAATQHTQVGGYAWASTQCMRCHADSQVDRVAAHLPFLISRGSHLRESCLRCHPSLRVDKPWGANFKPFDCFQCHNKAKMDAAHRGRAKYMSVSTSCVQAGCHPDGRN